MTLLLQDGLGTWSCTAKCTATAIAASSCNGKTAWLPVQEGGTPPQVTVPLGISPAAAFPVATLSWLFLFGFLLCMCYSLQSPGSCVGQRGLTQLSV